MSPNSDGQPLEFRPLLDFVSRRNEIGEQLLMETNRVTSPLSPIG